MSEELTHRHVVINAKVTHYRDKLAPEWSEHDPYVKMFLDRSCERTPTVVDLNTEDPSASYDVQITGLPLSRTVHNLFAVGIKGYVHTHTKLGVPVSSDAGQDFILLSDVLDAHKRGLDYEKEIELRMPSVDNLLKGAFTVTIPQGGLQMGGVTIDRPKTLASKFIAAGADVREAARPMMDYIVSTMQAKERLMGERSPTHARVRIPAYLGGPGMEMTRGAPLPAAAFMLFEVPKSSPYFWENAYRRVMARDNHVLSDWHGLEIEEKAQVMKETVCYLPQYFPYKGDTVDKNTRVSRFFKRLANIGCEDFESALEKFSGDCEDGSESIMGCLEALAQTKFNPDKTHPGLLEVQDLARNYKAGMVLSTVTSAAVGGADPSQSKPGAHMCVLMSPNAVVKKQIARVDARLADRLPFDSQYMREDLPVLEAESTGIYYSRHNAQIGAHARADLYREPAFAAMKTPIFHEFGTKSPFYREAMTVFYPDFARRGSNFIGFWFRHAKDRMRGVKFEDLENDSDVAELVPHPEIPEDVMAQMREDVMIRVPPNPLTLTEKVNPTHEQAELICATVASWNRTPTGGHEVIPAPIYSRHDLLDAQSAQRIIKTLHRKAGVYKVSYVTEPTVDGFNPGIRFLVYDDVAQSRPMYVYEAE